MAKLAISLDPSRRLYSSAPLTPRPRVHPQYHPVASKMLKCSSTAPLAVPSLGPHQEALQRLRIHLGSQGLDLTTHTTIPLVAWAPSSPWRPLHLRRITETRGR